MAQKWPEREVQEASIKPKLQINPNKLKRHHLRKLNADDLAAHRQVISVKDFVDNCTVPTSQSQKESHPNVLFDRATTSFPDWQRKQGLSE